MDLREEYQQNREEYYKELFELSGGCCFNCQASNVEFHIHHIVPLSLGGTNHILNLSLLCLTCHGKIHQKDFLKMSELAKQARMNKNQKLPLPPDEELIPLLIEKSFKVEFNKDTIIRLRSELAKEFHVSKEEKKRMNHAIRFVYKARLNDLCDWGSGIMERELFKTGDYVKYLRCTKKRYMPQEMPLSLFA